MNEEFIEVPEGHIRNFIQDWLNETKMGQKFGGVYLTDDQWVEVKKRFRDTFETNWKGEYCVTSEKLFNFINDIIYMLVNTVFEEMLESGKYNLGWNSEQSDFYLISKDQENS